MGDDLALYPGVMPMVGSPGKNQKSGSTPLETKICSKCGLSKPPGQFHRDPGSADGRYSQCKDCKNAAQRALDRSAYFSRYYSDPSVQRKRKAARRVYREANAERIRAYRQANADRIAATNRANQRKRRSLRAGATVADLSAAQETRLLSSVRHCAYCGKQLTKPTLDHIEPLSEGGDHTLANIAVVCKSCNSRKHTASLLTYLFDAHLQRSALVQTELPI